MKKNNAKKKMLIHFAIYLPLTLLFTGLSAFGFSKTNVLSEEIEFVSNEIKEISIAISPLSVKVNNNNKIINNEDKIYYCNTCNNFYDYSYDYCPVCSDVEHGIIVELVDSTEKKNELREENRVLLERISVLETAQEAALVKQQNISSSLDTFQSISIICTPVALVLLLIMLFARKE